VYTKVGAEHTNQKDQPLEEPRKEQTTGKKTKELGGQTSASDKGKVPTMEHFHTLGSMGIMLAWGDKKIPKPLDEVVDIEAITYDKKIQVSVTRASRKRKLNLDNTMVMTVEETLLDAKKDKVNEMLGAVVAISHATIDKEREDDREVVAMRIEL